ncbi:hypothetical protein [Streptomyces vinaceus]|uniref:hypothetical protein n=1 Tax=Streptomyces vinaceus TaxID=1960 RepID=UPI0036A7053B
MNTNLVNTAASVIHAAMEQGRATAASLAYALESAQLLQSPETAAERATLLEQVTGLVAQRDRLRARVAERTPGLTEQAALLAEMIGDVQPARVTVLLSLGEAVRDQREHDHSQREDWYCTNLVAFMGERMGPVLRRLLNSEAKAAQLAARVAELETERHGTNEALSDAAEQLRADRDRIATLEAERSSLVADRDAQIVEWLGKKSREYGTSNREARAKAEAVWRMADKLSRGAVRPLEDPHDSPLHHTYRLGHDLPHCECPPSAGRHTSACPARFGSEVPRG